MEINKSNRGLANVKINNDTKKLTVYYKGTTIKKVGEIITILSIPIYFILIKKKLTKNNAVI